MKKCSNSNCKKDNPQPLLEFNKKRGRSNNGKQDRCRSCNRETSRIYYAANKEKHIKTTTIRKNKIKQITQNLYCLYLLKHSCIDCGNKDIVVLEPDHLRDKEFNIGGMISGGYTWKRIIKELEKCEIVCANCHSIRTQSRFINKSYKIRFKDTGSVGQTVRPPDF